MIKEINQRIGSTPWKLQREYIAEIDYWNFFVPEVIPLHGKKKNLKMYLIPENYRDEKKESIKKLNNIFKNEKEIEIFLVREKAYHENDIISLEYYFAVLNEGDIFPLKYRKSSDESWGKYLIERIKKQNQITLIKENNVTESPYQGLRKIIGKVKNSSEQ